MTRILVPYHLDEYRPGLDVPYEPAVTITRDLGGDDVWARLAPLYADVADAVAADIQDGGVPLVMSGDCMVSQAVVAGLQRARAGTRSDGDGDGSVSVVWFDAHGDVQTLETTTSGYLGGMPLRMLAGYRPELVAEGLGLRPVAEDRIVLVDGRDLDPPERDYLAASEIRQVFAAELDAAALPGSGPVYLHLDLDVVDGDELPGLLFPVPGGPSASEVGQAVRRVLDTGRVGAVGLGCTWHDGHGAADAVGTALPF
ncbi:arginase family protein [Jiangella ureilytica]|uniref:Arginase family protein n=1 Tax=Jiangella ureilytica TaxID=2530374 RepID=A0A4R4RCX1_9ACTN|nr:arginase family protein [Jiangella ureilytica]TDC47128.1 arginase family protein [Jiangella ureilytica]